MTINLLPAPLNEAGLFLSNSLKSLLVARKMCYNELNLSAGIVQWLVCKFSKLEMRVRFSLPAPFWQGVAQLVARSVRDAEAVGSSPITLTMNRHTPDQQGVFGGCMVILWSKH